MGKHFLQEKESLKRLHFFSVKIDLMWLVFQVSRNMLWKRPPTVGKNICKDIL